MVNLDKWASKQSRFVKIPDGGKIQGVFIKAEEVQDTFNPDSTKIRYTLEIEGSEKLLESMSASLARQMAEVKEGEIIEIFRSGEGRNTIYKVEKIVGKNERNQERKKSKTEKPTP